MKRNLHIVLLVLMTAAVAGLLAMPMSAGDREQVPVQMKAIGHPIWKPVDFHVFTARLGDPPDFADFGQNMVYLLYPLRHQDCGGLGRGPGDPHQPPYIHEMEAGMDVMNFTDANVFKVADFSIPYGIWAIWMNVPNPGMTGSSPDFKSGPIIPNSLFPIHVAGETYRNNQLWDPYVGTFDVPPLDDQLPPPICLKGPVDGPSHFPIFYAESAYFGPGGPIQGHYELRVTMTDATGNGWAITVPFTVR
jgi:hypothetical protein